MLTGSKSRARADSREGLFRSSLGAQEQAVHLVDQGGAGIHRQGAPVFLAGALPIELVEELDLGERGVSLAQGRVELERALDRRPGLGHDLVRRKQAAGELDVSIGQAGIGEREGGILRDREVEVLDGPRQRFRGEAGKRGPSLKVELVGLGVDRGLAGQLRILFRGDLDADLLRDRAGHVALQGENVAKIALVAFRPHLPLAGDLNEPRVDAHAVVRAEDRALDDGLHVELPRDLAAGISSTPCSASPTCARSPAARRCSRASRSVRRSFRRRNSPARGRGRGSREGAREAT